MTIPATISTDLANLQAQVLAASPLNKASHATITALQLNAASLLNKIQEALAAPENVLDSWSGTEDILDIIAGVEGLLTAAQDQEALALLRGVVGRATTNLGQFT